MTADILREWEAQAREESRLDGCVLFPNTRILLLIQALRKAEAGLKFYADNLIHPTGMKARETLAAIEVILKDEQ